MREKFGYEEAGDDIGECWGISAYPERDGIIENGKYKGFHLSELWNQHPELFGNIKKDEGENEKFPLLVKIIDAKEDLSIQVHPNDCYAMEKENHSLGKTECWYILDCPENAKLVIGHNANSTDELTRLIEEEKWSQLICEVPVKKGDFIQINPGTVHAIKGGFVILETQQSSNVTYRVYDYDRMSDGKKRELHIEKCKEVITTPAPSASECILESEKIRGRDNQLEVIYAGMYYEVFKMRVKGTAFLDQKYHFLNITITDGIGKIDGTLVRKGTHLIVPYDYGVVLFEGDMEIIASTVR